MTTCIICNENREDCHCGHENYTLLEVESMIVDARNNLTKRLRKVRKRIGGKNY